MEIKKGFGRVLYLDDNHLELNSINQGVDIDLSYSDMANIINYWLKLYPDLKQEIKEE